jgi:hypothetical protein
MPRDELTPQTRDIRTVKNENLKVYFIYFFKPMISLSLCSHQNIFGLWVSVCWYGKKH